MLTGRGGVVRRAFPLRNIHPESERAYQIDPVDEHHVARFAAEAGEELVAVFHSHPASAAYPSRTDLSLARPGLFYLIVSLAKEPPDVRVYRLEQAELRPVPFRKLDGPVGDWAGLR